MTDDTMINGAMTGTAPQRLKPPLILRCSRRGWKPRPFKAKSKPEMSHGRPGLAPVPITIPAVLFCLLCLAATAQTQNLTRAQTRQQLLQDLESSQLRDAVLLGQQAVSRWPLDAQFRHYLGVAYFKTGDTKQAQEQLTRARELDPADSATHFDLALVLLSHQDDAGAATELEAAIKLNSSKVNPNALTHELLGRAYLNSNRSLPAVDEFKIALKLDPAIKHGHYNLGFAYFSLGRNDEAISEYKEELRRSGESPAVVYELGRSLVASGKYETALTYLQRATQLDAPNPDVWYTLGKAQALAGQAAQAESSLREAAELSPKDPSPHYQLARVLEKLGRGEEARSELERFAELKKAQPASAGMATGRDRLILILILIQRMKNLRKMVAVSVLLMTLGGAWILRGAAQVNTAPNHKGSAAKPEGAAQRPGVEPSAVIPTLFVDVTRAAGIDFHLTCGSLEKLYIVETMCGGAAAFDYDNDGWMDILLIDGSSIEDYKAGKCHPPRLYHNNHDGTFTDVSAKSGLNFCGWGYGVAIGDFDNDGWEDVYITGFHGSALYHNNHDGTFTDVTAKAGVANADRWGTSAAFGDYDNDGNLDLYVANYVDLDINNLPKFGSSQFCQYRGIPVNCGPRGLKGARDRLYHNNGDGTFTDVAEKLGIDTESYYGLGVLWLDYDKDGCLDLYVANDSSPSLLYHNNCKGGFTEVGAEAGVAYSSDGHEQAGMGIDAADYDRDGWPDIVKTNFSDDDNNLYHNDHNGEFTDVAGAAGVGAISNPYLGFGAKFLDYDNDGWLDIFVANGHVDPQVEGQSFGVGYAERPFLFHNLKNGKFEEVGQKSGGALAKKYVGRAALTADFWNRGREDLLITSLDASPVLLRNEVPSPGHWLRIKTIGSKSNRDGFGARIEITVEGSTRVAEVRAGSSFESSSDPRAHFGLGAATKVDAIVIRWPSGQVDKLGPVGADQELTVREGSGVVEKASGQRR